MEDMTFPLCDRFMHFVERKYTMMPSGPDRSKPITGQFIVKYFYE
jgi:hypothetical protein